MRIALDANLLLLLVVGLTARDYIPRHRRLKSFTPEDFDLLIDCIGLDGVVVTTPNALTEASNLLEYGVYEPLRSELYRTLAQVVHLADERYVPSREVADGGEFLRLGLADCAWLKCLGEEAIFITDELPLYIAATANGIIAYNFTHLRQERGLLPT